MLGPLQSMLSRLAPDVDFVKGSVWDGFADGHGGDGYLNLHDGPYKAQVGFRATTPSRRLQIRC